MAHDTAAVMDAAGFISAHIVGQSMGGMIAQRFAIEHPSRTRSLTSIYSCPNTSYLRGNPHDMLEVDTVSTLEDFRAAYAAREQRSAPSDDAFDPTRPAILAEKLWKRSYHPEGEIGQVQAVISDDRSTDLGRISAPTAVIHGREDRLVDYTGGFATAQAIPGAEMFLFAEMGHEIHPTLWNDFVHIIHRTAVRAR